MRPPVFLFDAPKRKTALRAGVRKKRALTRTPCFLRHAVRGMASLRSRRCLSREPASQRTNVREKTYELYKDGRGNDQPNS